MATVRRDRAGSSHGRVEVIAVTYRGAADLPGFLESLPAVVAPWEFEPVAVDNTSTDAGVDPVGQLSAVVKGNRTPSGGRRRSIRVAPA